MKHKSSKKKYPKKYTARLSRKDKKKQLTALGKLKKAYSKGKYLDRPKLKSYKKKNPVGQVNFINYILKQKLLNKYRKQLKYQKKH